MRDCHREMSNWLTPHKAQITIDAAGNFRTLYPATNSRAPRLLIASHLDTVPNAGAFDGILGVVIGVALLELLHGEHLPFGIEVIGFSEEEGVRFGAPFIGSRALRGNIDESLLNKKDANGITVRAAIEQFGLDPNAIPQAALIGDVLGYLEFHIEQGPVLDDLGLPLAAVETIVGQSRLDFTFLGCANHAGTTPMRLRHDALAAAAEWISEVEQEAARVHGLVATVGSIVARPGAANVIPGEVSLTLDARHQLDDIRKTAVAAMIRRAEVIAAGRKIRMQHSVILDQSAVAMDPRLVDLVDDAIRKSGCQPHRMVSGAGHDAMILAPKIPAAMIFLRSPGGISHSPEECVRVEDVAKALEAGMHLIDSLSASLTSESSRRTQRA